ncbi:aldo/keto reductase [Helicobacter didelphidarum]|uniref:Aldo/keto reductase n=2 Tax=Helicobacter didelphidarum TaxID=2040648 RepID=A0A3D8II82_9HELI|nr:aldo/keto reductase [Helicobacter didelphidarum]RDU64959.1 aldo/keto reductase [Helicobacter didelphidarum]
MNNSSNSRREFMKTTAIVGGAVVLGGVNLFGANASNTQTQSNTHSYNPNTQNRESSTNMKRDSQSNTYITNKGIESKNLTQDSTRNIKDSTFIKPQNLPQRKIGNLNVSALGLGCMGMSANHGPARDKKEMIKLLHRAIELGITHFDTAEIYGPHTNEELLGEALKPYRDKITINTKFGLYYPFGKQMQDSSPKALRRALDGSLRRLKSDYVDLYTQHRVDTDTPIEEVAQTMQEFVKEGKIRAWALGEAGSKTIERACKEFAPVAMQSQYSMAFRELESNGIMKTCEKQGIALVAYSPLDRGFLTGVMNENTTFHPTLDFRAGFPRYTKEALRANQSIIRFIDEIAQSKRVNGKRTTIAQIALAWILAQRDFIIPIPETTNPAHLVENLGALAIHFSADEMRTINEKLVAIKIVSDRYPPNSDAARSVGL